MDNQYLVPGGTSARYVIKRTSITTGQSDYFCGFVNFPIFREDMCLAIDFPDPRHHCLPIDETRFILSSVERKRTILSNL